MLSTLLSPTTLPGFRQAALLTTALLTMALPTGCGSAAPEPPLQTLQHLTAVPRCTADPQCRTLPVGARACGGPSRYLVWSTLVNREEELQALARQVSAQEQAALAASGRVSNCALLPDPGAHCDPGLGQCIAGGSRPQGSPSQ